VSGRAARRGDDRLLNPGDRGDSMLDLTQFDAEPANLDLQVGATRVHHLPVRQPARQIAGLV
jgi:hypothetical protein